MTCVICDKRPAGDSGRCPICSQKLEAENHRNGKRKVFRFLTYRGSVVALYPNGEGRFVPELVKRDPAKLPKNITLDLNTYLEGFDRAQIKRMKAAVLQLAS